MLKKYWLIIIISGILVIGALYWYLNYQLPKAIPTQSIKEPMKETTETEGLGNKGIKSIPLEKPPFIK